MTHPDKLLRGKNLKAKKELGQNFLCDPGTAEMIISRAEIGPADTVLEIGAGLGALTIPAARKARKVYAVEKDRNLAALLQDAIHQSGLQNIEPVCRDILEMDIEKTVGEKPVVIIGNLPYNISSQVLIRLVESRTVIEKACLMFQKELAQRISARPGQKDYSRLSAVMRHCSDIHPVADIKPHLFFPEPGVHSRVVCITFYPTPDVSREKEQFLFKVIKTAFSKRRKTLKNALTGDLLHLGRDGAETALRASGIDPARRAENLDIKEFRALADAIWTLSGNENGGQQSQY